MKLSASKNGYVGGGKRCELATGMINMNKKNQSVRDNKMTGGRGYLPK